MALPCEICLLLAKTAGADFINTGAREVGKLVWPSLGGIKTSGIRTIQDVFRSASGLSEFNPCRVNKSLRNPEINEEKMK